MEAPPVRSVHEEPRAQLAPFPFRAAAFLFDGMLGLLIVSLVSLPWGREWNELQNAVMETARKPVPDLGIVLRFYAMMVSFHLPVLLLYHVGFNTSFGATPGKLLLGLRIVRCDGSRLTFSRALVRFAAEALSIMPLGAGFLLVLTNPLRQALHDLIADTQVIRLPRPSLVA